MDEQLNPVTGQATPVNTTQQKVEIAPQSANVENSSAPEQNEGDKRELNKMSQLEKERNEFRERAKEQEHQLKAYQEDLNRTFRESPEAYEVFVRDYNRLNPSTPLKAYEETYGPRLNRPEATVQTKPTKVSNYTPEEIASLAINKMKQEQSAQEANNAFNRFVNEHPEFSPEKATEKEKDLVNKVAAMADVYVNTYGMSFDDALKEAYASVPEVRSRLADKAKEEGELVGRQRTLAKGVGESAPSSSASTNIPSSSVRSKLNQAQQARFDNLAQKDPALAERYANNVLNGS